MDKQERIDPKPKPNSKIKEPELNQIPENDPPRDDGASEPLDVPTDPEIDKSQIIKAKD